MSAEPAIEAAVLFSDGDGIRRITLNRPEAANALRPVDRDRLIELINEADEDHAVRVVVIAANGRHFCSGADVTGIARANSGDAKRATDSMRKIMNGAQRLVAAVLDCGKPVIAVVNGAAAGIGAHLALAADLVVAAEDASFVEVFVRRGLVVDGGGAYLLPRRIGMQKAKELAFFGDKLPAAEALALGLVNRVVPAAELDTAVQDLLDATTRVVDSHLADVVTSSWGFQPQYESPADVAAWNLVYQQGALEGIGFDYSSGDGGSYADPSIGQSAWVQFPAADPWVTAVGGTTLAIGQDGTALADYPWSDYVTQVDSAGTGYTSPPPGDYQGGSGGGVSPLFTEPGYQRSVVPAALATSDGTTPADRVVPDISANAGASVLIGYTGAITAGVYDQTISGGTSASSPLMAGLEADAMQAAGHAIGFANPALYKLYGTPAISDVGPVNPDDPPVLIGDSVYFGPGDYLDTTGLAEPSLVTTNGYDDTTGIGAPGQSFLTAFAGL